jgi:hypothetical protein
VISPISPQKVLFNNMGGDGAVTLRWYEHIMAQCEAILRQF